MENNTTHSNHGATCNCGLCTNYGHIRKFGGILVGVLLVILIVFALGKALAVFGLISNAQVVQSSPNTIVVNGSGDVYATADVATFSYSVTETAKTVADAQSQSADVSNKALAFLTSNGVAAADIQTTDYSIDPQYSYSQAVCPPIPEPNGVAQYCPQGQQTLTGYQVSQTTSVKVRDTSKVGDILSGIGALGVTNVSSLQFSIDNPDALQAQAQSKAIADAKSKAQALAQSLGVHLGKVVSFSENSGNVPAPVVYSMEATADTKAASVPDVSTGQNDISDSVSVTYEIR